MKRRKAKLQEDGGTCWEITSCRSDESCTWDFPLPFHRSFPEVLANTCAQPVREQVQESAQLLTSSEAFWLCRLPVCLLRCPCTFQVEDALQRAPAPSEQLCLVFNVHILIFQCATKNITEEIQVPPRDSPQSKSENCLTV